MDWVQLLLGTTRGAILRLLRRSSKSIGELAEAIGISGNAVRGHLSELRSDGLVKEAGQLPSTGGKPAQAYDLTPRAEELFPKAYAAVLAELLSALTERDGSAKTRALLESVGHRAAQGFGPAGGRPSERVETAAEALGALGGELEVAEVEGGWDLKGPGCPLSAVVEDQPHGCEVARAFVEFVAELPVEERCDRDGERPRCRFYVQATPTTTP